MEPRWRPLVYLPVATALSLLTLVALPGLGIFAAVFFMFAIPYLLGERRPKVLAMAAAVMLLATGVSLVSFLTWESYQPYTPLQVSDDGVLTGGTVDPVFGDEETTFTFRVVYTYAEPPLEPPRVHITSTFFASRTTMNQTMVQEDPGDQTFEDGVVYVVSTKLPSSTHYFHFAVLLADGRWVVTSDAFSPTTNSRGPVNMPPLVFFGGVAAGLIPLLYMMVGIPLFLVIMAYWWFGKAKKKRQRFVRRRKCPSCGSEWPLEEKTCPSCGLKV
jgi:hypothetical protein